MDILALDLGTHTGFTYNRGDFIFQGTWELALDSEVTQWGKERRTRTKDPRIERLCTHLKNIGIFDLAVFEDIEFSTYRKQTQLWASFRTSAWLCVNAHRFDCVPVKTLKTFAGHGNADKSAMSRFLKARHPYLWTPHLDDNAIDATWIWLWAKNAFARSSKQNNQKNT